MKLYEGYVRVNDNKRPLDSFKDNSNLKTWEEIKNCSGIAGKLAHDIVLIDIDNMDQGECLLRIVKEQNLCCQVRKTNRGYHFYFRNNGLFGKSETRRKSAIGLTIDIKVGYSSSLDIIRLAGQDRPIIYDTFEQETQNYQTVPQWLRTVNSNVEFFGQDEGDGRNDSLYKYILVLMRSKFTRKECLEVLNLINEYVFAKPLSEKEFATVTRDEAFQALVEPAFYEGKCFLHDEFAEFLIKDLHIKRIDGLLHVYNDGIYVSGSKIIEHHIVNILPRLKSNQRNEVLKFIDTKLVLNSEQSGANLIAFKNGVLNIENDSLLPFSPEYVITNKIPWNYNPQAQNCRTVDQALELWSCSDSSIRNVLEELAGYCMFRRNELRKAFILIGDKGNGKSTFMDMLGTMIGQENFSALDLRDLSDRFRMSLIVGKLANLGDDISSEPLKDTSIFKKIVTGDPLTAEQKNVNPFTFRSHAKLIFCANSFPKIDDPTGAVFDRLIVIPFKATFERGGKYYQPFLKDSLRTQEAIEYFITLAVKGLKRVVKQFGFSQSTEIEKTTAFYRSKGNTVYSFARIINVQEIEKFPSSVWYERYINFCNDNGFKAVTNHTFGTDFKSCLNLESMSRRHGTTTKKFYRVKS